MWENRVHDYDICIKCAQADRFIEMVLDQEEDQIRNIIGIPQESIASHQVFKMTPFE